MRGILFAAAIAGLASGCCSPTTTGWQFQVGRPGAISVPAAVQQGSGVLAVSPVAAFPAEQPGRAVQASPMADDCQQSGGFAAARLARPIRSASPAYLPDNCTLDKVCQDLDEIKARLAAQTRNAERLQMPKTPCAS